MGHGTRAVFFREADRGDGKAGGPVSAGPTEALHGWFTGLSFDDANCWAFGCLEGDLDEIYWKYARRELQQKLELKLGEINATLMSHHNSFVMIVNAALGDGKSSGPPTPGQNGYKNMAEGHGDVESAVAAINAAMMF